MFWTKILRVKLCSPVPLKLSAHRFLESIKQALQLPGSEHHHIKHISRMSSQRNSALGNLECFFIPCSIQKTLFNEYLKNAECY